MKLRKATLSELPVIWDILQQAIEQRKQDGSEQWQHGYPNEDTVLEDIHRGYAHVLADDNLILAYAAVIFEEEPAYRDIKGTWLTEGDYVVVHRVATANGFKGKGVASSLFKFIENLCAERGISSIKVDTNYDNAPMLKILEKLNYTYCGEVSFNGSPRRAYEKIIVSA